MSLTERFIDLNDSSPAAPSGYQDGKWQMGPTSGNEPNTGYPIYPVSVNVPATGGALVKTADYSAAASDCGKTLSFEGSSALTYTLLNPPAFTPWCVFVQNNGTANVNIDPNGLQINGSGSSLVLEAGTGAYISTDGTNYKAVIGGGGGSSPSGPSGTYNINFGILGQPAGSSATLGLFVFTEAVNFAANFSGSKGKCGTNPTSAQSWTINKNGVSIGSVSISTAGDITFTSSGAVSFVAGDLLALVGSASQDPALSNVDIVLAGIRASVTSTPINVIPFSWIGKVPVSQLLGMYTFTSAITFQANWAGAAGKCGTNPAATWTATIYKNGSQIGTVTISTSGAFAFASTGSASVSFVAGDEMTAVAGAFDASLQNVAFSFSGSAGGFVQLGADIGGSSTSPIIIGVNGKSIAVADDTGSANAYVVTPPYGYVRTKYARLVFRAANANTGITTLDDGGGALALNKGGARALTAGDIASGQIVEAIFDGANYQMISWSGASGGGGGSVSLGPRASLPSSPSALGSVYACTDSPFSEYVSDGAAWNGRFCGVPVSDPALDSSYVQLQTASCLPSIDSSKGGYIVSASGSGDNCFCYGKPVTPSSTLKISCGLTIAGQGGLAIWNANTGNVVFFRLVSGGISNAWNSGTLYYSRYHTGGLSANTSNKSFANPWPHWGSWAVRFDGTDWYLETYMDVSCTHLTATVYSEALSSWIGTNFTHVGFAVNFYSSGSAITSVWGQHFNLLSE